MVSLILLRTQYQADVINGFFILVGLILLGVGLAALTEYASQRSNREYCERLIYDVEQQRAAMRFREERIRADERIRIDERQNAIDQGKGDN